MDAPKILMVDTKDKLLNWLVENCQVGEIFYCININHSEENTGLDAKSLHALLSQFGQQGLLKYGDPILYVYKTARFILDQNAVDLKLRGGFKILLPG